MKVRIVNRPSGLLNGRDWPDAGETIEVADVVGADMCAGGIAVPVVDDGVETAVVSEGEVRSGDEAPKGNASRDDWVLYAIGKGATDAEVATVEDGGSSRDELRTKYGTQAQAGVAEGQGEA